LLRLSDARSARDKNGGRQRDPQHLHSASPHGCSPIASDRLASDLSLKTMVAEAARAALTKSREKDVRAAVGTVTNDHPAHLSLAAPAIPAKVALRRPPASQSRAYICHRSDDRPLFDGGSDVQRHDAATH
jgi:hypothetical protein